MNQTQHPFGDPSATQYHQQDELIRELRRRVTRECPPYVAPPSGQAPVHGEILVPGPGRGWTVLAVALLLLGLGACAAAALAL